MKNVSNLLLTFGFCLSLNLLFSQSVILINGVPTKVQLEGTEIVAVKGEVKNYMSGFDSSTVSQSFQYAELRLNQQGPAVAEGPVKQPKAKVVTKTITSDSPIISGNYFKFGSESAILTAEAIREIETYATKLKSGVAATVLLESFHKADNKESMELTQNRLEACKKYFEVNGVSTDVIVTNMYPSSNQSDKVSITIR